MDDEIISKSAFARELEITKTRIGQYVRGGMPVRQDGKLNKLEALAWISNTIKAKVDGKGASIANAATAGDRTGAMTDDPRTWDLPEATRRKEIELAVKHQLANDAARGAMINREIAERTVFELARENRDGWMAWPGRVAILMVSELGIEPRALSPVLTRHVRQHLEELGEIDPTAVTRAASSAK